MRQVSCVALLLMLLTCRAAAAATFTVGADGACSHSSLFLAIAAAAGNGPALDEVRVASNQSYTSIVAPVASHSVRVRGGYASCSATTPSGRTVISGTSSGSSGTFTTSGTAAAYQLTLENLELRDSGAVARRGGALRIEGNFDVVLRNTLVRNNTAGRGGGIYIDGGAGAELVIDANSVISNNTAAVGGGGIYCQNGGSILMQGLILANVAEDGGSDPAESGNGGGVALYGCAMNQAESTGFRGVLANTARRHGGGYYLRNGVDLFLTGNDASPAEITDNIAADTGGGIAVNDDLSLPASSITLVQISDSWIDSNRAPTGAGIGMIAGGEVSMARTLDAVQCHNATYCSSLSFNDVPSGGGVCIGAAAYVGPSSVLRLRNTRIEENCLSDSGWSFRQRADSQLRIDSSVVARNGGSAPFFIQGTFTGLLEIAWSTIYGNLGSARIGFITLPDDPGSNGTLRIYGSLVGEPFQRMTTTVFDAPTPMTTQYDCLIVDTYYDAPGQLLPRSHELAPPYNMIAPASGNYRLSSGTALPVDACDESLAPRAHGDADLVTSVYDAPRQDTNGVHDIGAYELVVAAPPAQVFSDGFE